MSNATIELLSQTNFTLLDWLIVLLYLVATFMIGVFSRKYIHSMSDYLVAGRGVGTRLGIATLAGTEMGLVTVMYNAQKGFTGGFAAFHIGLVAGIVTFFVGLSGFIVARLRKYEVLTIPEFYEKRFDKKTRVLGGIMLALGGILNMGLFLKVGSMFIVGVTGLSAEGAALPIVMVILLVLALVYTALGGMVSVIITDYLQYVVLSFGTIIAVVYVSSQLGFDNIFNTISSSMGERGLNPLLPESGFGPEYILWMIITAGLVSCAIWPTAVSRALAADSEKTVKKQYMWASITFMIRFLVPMFLGICAFVYLQSNAELGKVFAGKQALSNLYAMPVFLGKVLPLGLIGIITAAMIAAFMSTHDSYLLVWSSVITQDIVAPLKKELTQKKRIKLTRIILFIIGGYILFWGLFYKGREDIWDYMAVTGSIYFTGAMAVLVLGLYWKRASSTGAFLALLSGLAAIAGLTPVQDLLGFKVASARVGLLAVGFSFAIMVIASLIWPDKKEVQT